ncbi:unnamed protein product [Caretta caretta]
MKSRREKENRHGSRAEPRTAFTQHRHSSLPLKFYLFAETTREGEQFGFGSACSLRDPDGGRERLARSPLQSRHVGERLSPPDRSCRQAERVLRGRSHRHVLAGRAQSIWHLCWEDCKALNKYQLCSQHTCEYQQR